MIWWLIRNDDAGSPIGLSRIQSSMVSVSLPCRYVSKSGATRQRSATIGMDPTMAGFIGTVGDIRHLSGDANGSNTVRRMIGTVESNKLTLAISLDETSCKTAWATNVPVGIIIVLPWPGLGLTRNATE